MRNAKYLIETIFCLLSVAIVLIFAPISLANQPKPGQPLPAMTIPAPHNQDGKKALGLNEASSHFTVSDLKSDLVLIEVIGVYCPQCFKQAPEFNKLYTRLNRGKTKGRVAMFALAAGGTEPEIDQLIKSGQYTFPVISDMRYEVHKLMGEPKTPFTIICRPDGTILYTHLGIITDIDSFYGEIKGFLNKL